MSVMYNVPAVAQTSNNTCWHASSLMIWYFWQGLTGRQGPMNTIADNYKNDRGVTPSQFITLAEKVGLKKISPNQTSYTPAILEQLLKKFGPLWCAGFWFGVGHIIVLTGVSGDIIFFNDPDHGIKKTNSVSWFNSKISNNVDGCLMHKNPAAY